MIVSASEVTKGQVIHLTRTWTVTVHNVTAVTTAIVRIDTTGGETFYPTDYPISVVGPVAA